MTKKPQRKKTTVGLVFAEDSNDASALINLANALRDDLPNLKFRRRPLILIRNRAAAEARKNAQVVASVVAAAGVTDNVKLLIAHQDCDDFEPSHSDLSDRIERELKAVGLNGVVPVTPAWEIEAWWFLWPDAVAAVNSTWSRLKRTGCHGRIKDAKETLRNDLRKGRKINRDYEESDSIAISKAVRDMNIVANRQGNCESFDLFAEKLQGVRL